MTDQEKQNNSTTDTQSSKPNSQVLTNKSISIINEYSNNAELIKFVKTQFKRLKRVAAIKLIRAILSGKPKIHVKEINEKHTGLLRYNKSKFDEEDNLKESNIISLQKALNGLLAELGKDVVQYDETEHTDIKIKKIDGRDVYVLEKNIIYDKMRRLTCDEGGEVHFKYDFKNPDMDIHEPKNTDSLQRCNIQIVGNPVRFDFPIECIYSCPRCYGRTTKKAYDVISTKGKIACENMWDFTDAEGKAKSKMCMSQLYPDEAISPTREAYYCDVAFEDEDNVKQVAGAISFEKVTPGFYEGVVFKIRTPSKMDQFHIMDVKEIDTTPMILPPQNPEENYIFTLQRTMDKFILNQTGLRLYGLFPMKVGLIMQHMFSVMGTLISNCQIVGDPSTGKTTVIKYYGFLLHNHRHYMTNGQSVSIPSLRGTRASIALMGKEHKIVTMGYLGSYQTIHIDEAGDNPELIQHTKTFLLEDNYSYDKAGATGTSHKRTAHINISQNLDFQHLGQYNGMIRKAYKESSFIITDINKPEWSEGWDLHLPLYEYMDNPYLMRVIKEKRIEYKNKQMWWIDGYDYALHERFPLYFYLVNEQEDEALSQVTRENTARKVITENVELMRALKNDALNKYFLGLTKYHVSKTDVDNFQNVDKILKEYGLYADSRMKKFYYTLLKASRIINQRMDCTEQDYDLVRWLIEKTNRKLDVKQTIDYSLKGPPDVAKAKKLLDEIEDSVQEQSTQFGLQNDSAFDR